MQHQRDAVSVPRCLFTENRATEHRWWLGSLTFPSGELLSVSISPACSVERWAGEGQSGHLSGLLRGWDCHQSRQLANPDFLNRDEALPGLIPVTSAESGLNSAFRWRPLANNQEVYCQLCMLRNDINIRGLTLWRSLFHQASSWAGELSAVWPVRPVWDLMCALCWGLKWS